MGIKKTPVAVSVTTTATRLVDHGQRAGVLIAIETAAGKIYLGKDNTVTTSNGIPLTQGSMLSDFESDDQWWAIAASGTVDVRVMEVLR